MTIDPQDDDRTTRAARQETEADSQETIGVDPSRATPFEHPPRIGAYRLEAELGRGGQGTVYLAEDTRLQRKVALKILSGGHAFSKDARARFRREAEIASRLQHPAICTVYDVGEHEGIPYIAMQYVQGTPLDVVVTRSRAASTSSLIDLAGTTDDSTERTASGRDGVRSVIAFFEATARAVHQAHEAGLVHRDIKPANLMVTREGDPVVLDFGLARDESQEEPTLTASSAVLGTPSYMSPEQIEPGKGRIDRRTDVYSLGVALFEALTLRRPFAAPTREALYRAILEETPPDPTRLNPLVSPDLKVVLDVALEKDRDRRYASAAALADDLRAILEDRPIAAKPIPLPARLLKWARRRPTAAALLFVLLTGLPLLVGLVVYMRVRQPLVDAARDLDLRKKNDALLERGFLEAESRHWDEAWNAFSRARRDGRPIPEALAGMMLVRVGQHRDADAVSLADRHAGMLERFSGLKGLRDYAALVAAGTNENEALDVDLGAPSDPVDFFLHGLRHMTRSESGDAEALAAGLHALSQAVLRSKSPRPVYYFQLAAAAALAGEESIARAMEESIRGVWPTSAVASYWRGVTLQRLRDGEACIQAFEDALRQDPKFGRAATEIGFVLMLMGRDDEARVRLAKAIAIDPTSSEPHRHLGNIEVRAGNLEDAIAHFQRAIELEHDFDDAHFDLAQALESAGRPDEALDHYRAAAKIDPFYLPYHEALAIHLADFGEFAEALEEAVLVVRRTPARAETLIRMAWKGNLFCLAARLSEEIIARDEPVGAAFLWRAARAAARAGIEDTEDDELIGDAKSWRERSRRWVEAALDRLDASVRANEITDRQRDLTRKRWRSAPDLGPYDPDASANPLSEDERKAWAALWERLDDD